MNCGHSASSQQCHYSIERCYCRRQTVLCLHDHIHGKTWSLIVSNNDCRQNNYSNDDACRHRRHGADCWKCQCSCTKPKWKCLSDRMKEWRMAVCAFKDRNKSKASIYIGWQWRNFVPYPCKLIFAAIYVLDVLVSCPGLLIVVFSE